MPRDDLTSRTFGRLTVECFLGYPSPGKAQWRCRCICGSAGIVVFGYNLKNGNTSSCGCFKIQRTKENNSTHGRSRTNLYHQYSGMLSRCLSVTNFRYPLYGARGITVCERWLGPDGFLHFVDDMGPRPSLKHSIEREDNDGPYSSKNCRWATQKEQMRNRRGNVFVEVRGSRMLLLDYCESMGVPFNRIRARLHAGWNVEHALTAPFYARRA